MGRVRAYLLRSGFGPADADDLAQETFLRAFRSLATFEVERGSFVRWLGAIARNVARRRWHRRREPDSFDPELAEEMFAAPDNPGESPEAREEFQAVRACVDALPAELARIVRLRYVEGRTTRGVSAAAGLPEATVRLRLKEACALLAECLRGKGFLE
jgi:RNA polymerase sigma-70 factor (ECF subfamily)